MKTQTVQFNDNEYKVLIADKDEDIKKGLLGVKNLPKNKGMLFVFDEIGKHDFWMKDTLIPLLLIFMDESGEVIKTVERTPYDETLVGAEHTKYVLEVNPTDDIEVGDFMEGLDIDESKVPVMKILDSKGGVLYELEGGERIFSRKSTLSFIRKAKKADRTKSDKDYKRLGKAVFNELKALDGRAPEYVNAPN